jgi:hypothetical protein
MAPDFNFGRVLPESPTFVKEEQDDFGFPQPKFMANNQQYPNQFNSPMDGNGIDPSNLMMNGNMVNNNYGQPMSFGIGSGTIHDDDLDYLVAEDGGFNNELNNNQPGFFQNQPNNGVSVAQQSSMPVFSNTPDAAPISSPFIRNFNYNQYGVAMPNGFTRMKMERHPSDSRSPITPKTPALGGLRIGTPDSMNQNMLNQQLHNQARMTASNWDGTPGSNQSWIDSPMPSPHGHHMQQPGIHEVMQGRASVPAKLEGGHSTSMPSLVSQEAKKKRRRESHNLVERRRRDNINERIQDLSRLVPSHRLEDEKVRKHLQANGPLSPQGVSPPGRGDPATSHLAPGSARRATAGTITTGLPQEEKEKGPNKGDILNGAVAWTRDLMWHSYLVLQQQEQLKEYVESLGGTWPIQQTDDITRMMSELTHVVERNGVANFDYSRTEGTHLRVPGFTNYAGDTLQPGDPAIKAEGSDNSDLWFNNGGESGRNSLSIKEEDDFGMDMG